MGTACLTHTVLPAPFSANSSPLFGARTAAVLLRAAGHDNPIWAPKDMQGYLAVPLLCSLTASRISCSSAHLGVSTASNLTPLVTLTRVTTPEFLYYNPRLLQEEKANEFFLYLSYWLPTIFGMIQLQKYSHDYVLICYISKEVYKTKGSKNWTEDGETVCASYYTGMEGRHKCSSSLGAREMI